MPEEGLPLDVEDLLVRGEGGRVLLDVPRLRLAAGASLAVRGPSGAGKSSLLHALAGLLRADAGRVSWGGTDIARLPEEARARFRRERLGLVFQDFMLFDELGSLDNAAVAAGFAPASERAGLRERARGWLQRLGMAEAGERPTPLLSGGERQRVAVARALAHAPAVVLADEPTASLDRANADRLIADLQAIAADGARTLVVVSHDPALSGLMGRAVTLADGRIVEDTDA